MWVGTQSDRSEQTVLANSSTTDREQDMKSASDNAMKRIAPAWIPGSPISCMEDAGVHQREPAPGSSCYALAIADK